MSKLEDIDDLKNKVRKIDNIIFYGDVHISRKSHLIIKDIFKKNPDIDCIALELNKRRYKQLEKDPLFIKVLSKASKRIKKARRCIDSSFKEATNIGKEKGIPIKLIDLVPIPKIDMITTFKAIKAIKKDSNFKLTKSLDTIENIDVGKLGNTKEEKLIKEIVLSNKAREQKMAEELLKIKNKYNKIFVIVGYGHLDNIINLIK